MLDLLSVGTGHKLHAAGNLVGGRHRDPGGRDIGRVEPPISGILMPGNEPGIMGLLDEETGIPAEDVRSQQILDRIQDFRMTDHLVDPGEEHVAAVAHLALDRPPGSRLVALELAAKFGNLTLA